MLIQSLPSSHSLAGVRLNRIAVIGCGAIAQSHARAIAATPGARCTVLVDTDRARAEALRAAYFPEARVESDCERVAGQADAAIVAVPNAFHAETTRTLLRAGLHVLCEKPLAVSAAEARALLATAEECGRVLACGLVRRFFVSTELVREVLRREVAGRPIGFEIHESVWNWPLNRAAFDRRVAGGGVLMDLGPHVLDLLEVWFGHVELLESQDDERGGVEATAMLRLRCRSDAGDPILGTVFLSRAYRAHNRARIVCARGEIEVDPHATDSILLRFNDGEPIEMRRTGAGDPFARQLRAFFDDIREAEPVTSSARAAAVSVALIEACYRTRQPLLAPAAVVVLSEAGVPDFNKVLVTGATGSVGSRLVEMWAEAGRLDRLRCMTRSYRTAARMLRFPVETVEADLLDGESVLAAARGCDAILHLGVGDKAARETATLLGAARKLGIRRFVHVSTAAVYGRVIPASVEALQDDTPVVKTGEPYADEKAVAEQMVIAACARGLEAPILRPHIVYGPGLRWSAELATFLAEGRVAIVDEGGWCNLIYVDDLVAAITRALGARDGFGKPVFVTDGAPLRWAEYIGAHAALLGVETPRMARCDALPQARTARQWLRDSVTPLAPVLRSREFRSFVFESPAVQATAFPAYLALRERRWFRPVVARMRSGGGGQANDEGRSYDENWTAMQLSEARLQGARADSLLGFRAQVTFAEGLSRTASWLRLFNLIRPGIAVAESKTE
jgi:predicted dehydrogenase/nucleoside-diphosphate-sugar epimerase